MQNASKTNIVITMAGRGSRFYDAGYTVPKYEISAHWKSLFAWSLLSLHHFITQHARVIFVCLAENQSTPFITQECKALGIDNYKIIEINELTDGQATTAYISHPHWDMNGSLLVYNIDTFVQPRSLHPDMIAAHANGWIPCFKVPGNHWSFVDINQDGWATNVEEKNRISDYASIGLYWFEKANDYIDAYNTYFSNKQNLVKNERYIAPLYNHLINHNKKIAISDLPREDVHVLGTPAELDIFLAKTITLSVRG
ncbi:MAG: glycosyltransferase family 2 protein [Roseiflexaceae bacterium]